MAYLCYQGSQVYYEIVGKGAPLLYLHGWNGSMKSFKECLSNDLQKERQLIMLDLPGFGKSEYFPFSFRSISNLIEKLLRLHNLDKIQVMGFCMGGAFALDFTIRFPDRVDVLVLVETSFTFPVLMYPVLFPLAGKMLLRFFLFNPLGIQLTKQYLLLADYQYRDEFYCQFQAVDPDVSHAYTKQLFSYSGFENKERITGIQAKTKILIGEHTRWSIRSSARKLKELITDSEIVLIKQARHFPIEENRNAMINCLLRWELATQ